MIEVLSVASEAYPLIKTGGLADVVGALPSALAPHGVSMRVLLPGYPKVMDALASSGREVWYYPDFFGGEARLIAGRAGGLDVIALEAHHLFTRPGSPYLAPDGRDFPDNWRRYAALSFAAYELSCGIVEGYRPDILHCHDWQSGLVPAYVKYNAGSTAKTIITVHNIAFQGVVGWDAFNALRLDYAAAGDGAIEYFGNISYLKAGLATADAITTVSPTYAQEILTPEYGCGLEGLLLKRYNDLSGILNGVDHEEWSPGSDPALPAPFTAEDPAGKAVCKAALQRELGLPENPALPLFANISRLTDQKGSALIVQTLRGLLDAGEALQFALLGSGERSLENAFRDLSKRFPDQVAARIGFDPALSHRIEAGADFYLMPSRFEPCGLNQLYSLRYGAIPIVRATGGLQDSVIDPRENAAQATGIKFIPSTEAALKKAILKALALWKEPAWLQHIRHNGMTADFSWEKQAAEYVALYESVCRE